ncbi:MAG TPA: hypothetical protein VFK11_03855 [Candidatus Saccharimonadales bacterium]|nr:hypothetical protein [Candidatus Saccharimonadales bacterium]
MIHTILYVLFIIPFTVWLGYELKVKYSLSRHKIWIILAVITGITGAFTFKIKPDMVGNFLLHASGGVASAFLFVYLLKTLKLRFSWRMDLVLLFAFVSMLGVLNELAEYLFEFLGFGPFSFDKHDTWRDLAANTTGALVCWTVIKAASYIRSKKA